MRPSCKSMACRRIISSFVRLWVLTAPGIRERQRGKIRDCRPYPLERGLQGVVTQHLATHGGEAINTFAKIHWGGGEKDAALGSQLNHTGVSKKVRTSAVRGSCASWAVIRRRAPSGRWSSISIGAVGRGQTGAAGTSTEGRAAGAAGAAWWAAQRFFNSPPLTRNRLATWVNGTMAVRAMACSHRSGGMGSA